VSVTSSSATGVALPSLPKATSSSARVPHSVQNSQRHVSKPSAVGAPVATAGRRSGLPSLTAASARPISRCVATIPPAWIRRAIATGSRSADGSSFRSITSSRVSRAAFAACRTRSERTHGVSGGAGTMRAATLRCAASSRWPSRTPAAGPRRPP
jgi:hypothetical protein